MTLFTHNHINSAPYGRGTSLTFAQLYGRWAASASLMLHRYSKGGF